MDKRLLTNREYVLDEGRVNWYSSEEKLQSFQSVVLTDLWDTSSSAGDWSGYFVQKLNKVYYLIPFDQSNNWPRYGFTVWTGEVLASWHKKLTREQVQFIYAESTDQLPDDSEFMEDVEVPAEYSLNI